MVRRPDRVMAKTRMCPSLARPVPQLAALETNDLRRHWRDCAGLVWCGIHTLRVPQMAVKSQVVPRHHFGQQDNLGRMLREMFHHMEYRAQAGNLIVLNGVAACKLFQGKASDDPNSGVNGLPEPRRQLATRLPTAGREFGIPLPLVGFPAQ